MNKRSWMGELLYWFIRVGCFAVIVVWFYHNLNTYFASDILTMIAICCLGFFVLFCFALHRYYKGKRGIALLLVLLCVPLSLCAGIGLSCLIYAPQLPEIRAKLMEPYINNKMQSFINSLYESQAESEDMKPEIHFPFTVVQRLPQREWEVMDKAWLERVGVSEEIIGQSCDLQEALTLILLEADMDQRYISDFIWSNGQNGVDCAIIATIIDIPSCKRFTSVYFSRVPLSWDRNSLLNPYLLSESGDSFQHLLDEYGVKD